MVAPGTSRDGVGGAIIRMKKENFSMALNAPEGVAAVMSVTLFGVSAY